MFIAANTSIRQINHYNTESKLTFFLFLFIFAHTHSGKITQFSRKNHGNTNITSVISDYKVLKEQNEIYFLQQPTFSANENKRG